jgi:outer membrane protein assembly factor BamB
VKQIVEQTEKLIVGVGLADGKLLWQMPFAGARMSYNAATPIVEGQTVYITGGGRGTKALKIEKKGDAFEAKELWTNAQVATQFNTPVLKDGHLYGLSDKGNVFCLSAADGKTLWTDSAKRGNFGSIVDAGPALFLLTPDGVLTAFKPSDKEFSELAHYKVTEGQVYAYPVIAGNRIFIRDQNALTLFMLQ